MAVVAQEVEILAQAVLRMVRSWSRVCEADSVGAGTVGDPSITTNSWKRVIGSREVKMFTVLSSSDEDFTWNSLREASKGQTCFEFSCPIVRIEDRLPSDPESHVPPLDRKSEGSTFL